MAHSGLTIRSTLRDKIAIIGGLVVITLLLRASYRLYPSTIGTPIEWSGDSLLTMTGLQNMADGIWYFYSSNLGYPTSQHLQEFPAVLDGMYLVFARFLTLTFENTGFVFNTLFFLGFALNYVGAMIGLRMLRCSVALSVPLAVIYSMVPYNFLHGPGHVGLVWNFSIPIWAAFLLRQCSSTPLTSGSLFTALRNWRDRDTRRMLVAVALVGVATAITGFYYFAFFSLAAFPIAILAINRRIRETSSWVLWSIAWSLVTVVVQVIPLLLFAIRFGSNPSSGQRSIEEVVHYGLKPVGLMSPPDQSPLVDLFSMLARSELNSENAVSLGVLLGGFVLCRICLSLLIPRWMSEGERLGILMLVFALPFGGGYVLALFGFTQIRVWSRISIVLAALGVLMLGELLTKWSATRTERPGPRAIVNGLVLFLCLIQLIDSVPLSSAGTSDEVRREMVEVSSLTEQVVRRFGREAKVFMVPATDFPEAGAVARMADYEHLKVHLVEPRLNLSYGGVKGRAIPWRERLSGDWLTQVQEIKVLGFDVLWVDRFGWESSDNGLETVLKEELAAFPLLSATGRYAAYGLRDIDVGQMRPEVVEDTRQRVLSPALPWFGEGFSPLESDGKNSWRWSGEKGRLHLTNLGRTERRVEVEIVVELRREGRLSTSRPCDATSDRLIWRLTCAVVLPPNGLHIDLRTDISEVLDADPRDLRFRVLEVVTRSKQYVSLNE